MKLLLENWREYLKENKLRVFDFDDTLVMTDSVVYLTQADGTERELTTGQFATYELKDGESYEDDAFREFEDVENPREVQQMMNVLRNVVNKELSEPEGRKIVILTARSHDARLPIVKYLESVGLDTSKIEVHTLQDADPESKSGWVESQILQHGFDDIEFFDDSLENVRAVQSLKDKYNVRLRSRQISYADRGDSDETPP